MRVLVIGILIGILALTACAAPASSPRREGTPDAETPVIAPAEVESWPSGKLGAVLGEAVIIYERSGGLAGVSEQWSIYPDGRIVAGDGREWQVEPEQVKQLTSDIKSLGFFDMSGQYMPLNQCCDRFTYTLVVRSGDKINRVTTIDAAPEVPASLWEVLGAVRSFVNNAQDDN
ncbi:MAG: hypothetical protein ACE5HA_16730 [Anaerolineae bacterium]